MIWLVGARGMLGTEVQALLSARELRHACTDVETDITNEHGLLAFAQTHRPTWIINCAAYTAVDRAENEEALAHSVNAHGAGNVARAAHGVQARLLHVSTDYVFDGRGVGPYTENAQANPIGAYGRTKAAGETRVRDASSEHFIVRTSWLHGPHGPNFVATMLRLMGERPELRVVNDQHGSPTYAGDLAQALLAFIEKDTRHYGTYHFTNEGACTWHEFAQEIQTQALATGILHRAASILPIPTKDYPTPAARPANSVLSKTRIRETLGLSIPTWQDGLARHLRRLKEQQR